MDLGQLGGGQDGPATGPAQGLVGGEGDHVGHPHRRGMDAAGDEPGRMGGVEHEARPHRVGDLTEGHRVDDAGVGGRTGHDQAGTFAPGHFGHLVEVDGLPRLVGVVGRGGDAVGDEPPHLGGDAGRRPVGQMAAVVEPHGQDGVARLEEGLVDGQIGGGPGMGLHVGVLGPEQGRAPPAGQVLDLVDDLVSPVVTPTRIALGVLVGEDGPGGGQHGRRGEVLRGDELQGGRLAHRLVVQEVEQLGVLGQPRVEGGGRLLAGHGFSSRLGAHLELGDLGQTALVAAALEGHGEEGVHRVDGLGHPGGAAAEADHVGVVVAAGQVGGGHVVGQRRPYPAHLVGGDADADTGAAHTDPPLGPPFGHRLSHRHPEQGIVDRHLGRVGPEVDHLVPGGRHVGGQHALQLEPGVVRADGDLHA